jgi:hypothetical protein
MSNVRAYLLDAFQACAIRTSHPALVLASRIAHMTLAP